MSVAGGVPGADGVRRDLTPEEEVLRDVLVAGDEVGAVVRGGVSAFAHAIGLRLPGDPSPDAGAAPRQPYTPPPLVDGLPADAAGNYFTPMQAPGGMPIEDYRAVAKADPRYVVDFPARAAVAVRKNDDGSWDVDMGTFPPDGKGGISAENPSDVVTYRVKAGQVAPPREA
jgi:hypothetical protein